MKNKMAGLLAATLLYAPTDNTLPLRGSYRLTPHKESLTKAQKIKRDRAKAAKKARKINR